ncbi:Cobalamin (vitamin B12) biosynthesis CobH/CbiC, precorrin-8X methylmutase [Syntrophomonas zehnderi OL-4]|uniref:Cobalamin (Vitamin B12) biosynthesis CobH/CbiC, precorrin-8X methylmutase n=1 Tax=Syntrophomonas zehnderi OL-4 TaxID=690567 RepID=A0A0E3W3V0_9FIRM|nr:precorrin-8X methylmutase [Syntrophomonas zehnderi]CFY06901.1 Cobalamin (vitamin B12) biosynthesis CobH/CbiC, precorrin-8X methylmutase [Syntrophomonas zehnderi OL-4]
MDIIWDPQIIETQSMAIIEPYLQGYSFNAPEKAVVKRVVHTTGDPSIIEHIFFHPAACKIGIEALRKATAVFTDVNMLLTGINPTKLAAYGATVSCGIAEPEVVKAASKWQITRAAAAMRLWGSRLNDAIVAIGNAPTALFELLALIDKGVARPALIIGTPVGFVGAAESKEMMIKENLVPYMTIRGTRGGSTIAAAMVNALLYYEGDTEDE